MACGITHFFVLFLPVASGYGIVDNKDWVTHHKLRASSVRELGRQRAAEALLALQKPSDEDVPAFAQQPESLGDFDAQALARDERLMSLWKDQPTIRHIKAKPSKTVAASHPWSRGPNTQADLKPHPLAPARFQRADAHKVSAHPAATSHVSDDDDDDSENNMVLASPKGPQIHDGHEVGAPGQESQAVPVRHYTLNSNPLQAKPVAWYQHRWIYEVLFVTVGLALCRNFIFMFLFKLWHSIRSDARPLIAEAPRTLVVDVREGEWAKVVGTIVLEDKPLDERKTPLVSPLTGRECVFSEIVVETEDGSTGHRRACRDFVIEDEMGQKIAVYAGDVEGYHLTQSVVEEHLVGEMPESYAELLKTCRDDNGVPVRTHAESSIRMEEVMIEVGAQVVAVGVVVLDKKTGVLSLQSDTAVRGQASALERVEKELAKLGKLSGQKRHAGGLPLPSSEEPEEPPRRCLRSSLRTDLEESELRRLAAHVLVSDDSELFGELVTPRQEEEQAVCEEEYAPEEDKDLEQQTSREAAAPAAAACE